MTNYQPLKQVVSGHFLINPSNRNSELNSRWEFFMLLNDRLQEIREKHVDRIYGFCWSRRSSPNRPSDQGITSVSKPHFPWHWHFLFQTDIPFTTYLTLEPRPSSIFLPAPSVYDDVYRPTESLGSDFLCSSLVLWPQTSVV